MSEQDYDNALKLLKARLYAIEERKPPRDIEARTMPRAKSAFGISDSQLRFAAQYASPRRTRRIELKSPAVMQVLDGDLDEFMQAYLRWRTERAHKRRLLRKRIGRSISK